MNGYVINASSSWTHAMKRAIGPGARIPLDELYEQYGVKHSLEEGKDFVEWLRSVKLKDTLKWKIVFKTTDTEEIANDEDKVEEKVTNIKEKEVIDNVTPIVKAELKVEDVVGLSVRKGREILPKITDLNLLKYAFQEANQLSGKDSLCRIIRKRIKELQLSR